MHWLRGCPLGLAGAQWVLSPYCPVGGLSHDHACLTYACACASSPTCQVLARSKALDKLLGSYLEGGAASEADVGSLGELLTAVAHPSLPHQYGRLLAGAVAALGALLAADPLAPMATVRHGLQGAISLLKGGVARPVAKGSPQQRLATLEGELARQEAALTRTTLPREQSKLWGGVLQTLGEQLDLLQLEGPSGLPAEVMAALRPLQELQAALQARLKAATAPPPPGQTVEALVAEAEAAHARDDAALCRQLAAADARVRELEAQLAAAKAEAGVLRTRRVAAKADLAKAVEQLRTAGPAGAAAGKRAAAALEAGLGATGALAAAVEGAGGPAAAAMDAGMAESVRQRLVAGEVPAKLVGAVQQVKATGSAACPHQERRGFLLLSLSLFGPRLPRACTHACLPKTNYFRPHLTTGG